MVDHQGELAPLPDPVGDGSDSVGRLSTGAAGMDVGGEGKGGAMTAPAPTRLDQALSLRREHGLRAWHAALGQVLEAGRLREQSGLTPTEQERAELRTWLRTRNAVDACLLRQVRAVAEESLHGPRAVIAHDERTHPGVLEQQLRARGIQLLGRATESPVVLALVVVEQPDLLVLADLQPWVDAPDLLPAVRRFAPRTRVVQAHAALAAVA